MRSAARWLLLLFTLSVAGAVCAKDAWVIRGLVRIEPEPCSHVLVWNADAILHNVTDEVRTARVVATSVGPSPRGDSVTLNSHHSSALSRLLDRPDIVGSASMWVTRLDVPEGVKVEGRLEYVFDICGHTRPPNTTAAGVVAMPVFERLAPASERQMHFGTDLGTQLSRYNVGVYNAAEVSATAVVEVTRPACQGDAKVVRSFTVPARTLVQESLFNIGRGCVGQLNDGSVGDWVTYTSVTVDQPSLSYIVTLAGGDRPQVTLGFGSN